MAGGRRKGVLGMVITLCIVLVMHLVAICYNGWPCGSLYSDLCRNFGVEMQVVLALLATSSVLQFLALILFCSTMCTNEFSRRSNWLDVFGSLFVSFAASLSFSAVFYYNNKLVLQFWCHPIMAMGAGMVVSAAILQIAMD